MGKIAIYITFFHVIILDFTLKSGFLCSFAYKIRQSPIL